MSGEEFIDMGVSFDDVPEKTTVPAGKYRLRITAAKSKGNEEGEKPHVNISHEVIGHSEAQTVFHNLWLPTAKDPAEKKENKVRFIRGYMALFGIPFSGATFNVNDFVGKEAEVTLMLKERQESDGAGGYVPTGTFDNVIKVQSK